MVKKNELYRITRMGSIYKVYTKNKKDNDWIELLNFKDVMIGDFDLLFYNTIEIKPNTNIFICPKVDECKSNNTECPHSKPHTKLQHCTEGYDVSDELDYACPACILVLEEKPKELISKEEMTL